MSYSKCASPQWQVLCALRQRLVSLHDPGGALAHNHMTLTAYLRQHRRSLLSPPRPKQE